MPEARSFAVSPAVLLCASVSLRGSMSGSSSSRKTHRQSSWLRADPDGTEFPLSASGRRNKWRVGGWVGALCVKLKEVGMDGKGTLKMFRKKPRELIKTPSISKKSRAGSPGPQSGAASLSILQEQPRKDAGDAALSSSPCSSTTSSSLNPAAAGLQDSSLSCPGTPSPQHAKLAAMQGVGCPSPVQTLKRPTALSRHASAAGFPLPSWVHTKGQGKGALSPSPQSEVPESTVIEVEDIPALLRDVARFAEAVEKLKDVVLAEGKESQRPVAHECLGEVLRNLRQVINTYPLLNTVEILTAAGKLISKVKGFHYEASNETDKKDFEKAIETIAVAFSSNVSELLMGEVDSSTLLSLLPTEKSRSMENLYAAAGQGVEGGHFRSDLHDNGRVEEVDVILQRSEGGVDSALVYAKSISKYMKDLISYVEKRTTLEAEFAKGLQRLYQSCKHSITHPHMPLYSTYSLALEQDQEQSVGLQQANTTLHNQTFIQPLLQRKQEHEKKRKDIKELWIRAKRKLMECEANLRKAKQAYMVRCEEYEKAKTAACRAEEEGGGSTAKSVEKKKRVEEEARNKAVEAEATYRTCIADATTQQLELEHTKVTVLRQLQDVIKQSDQTLRSATISYYQLMHMQTVALPVHYQTLCESSKLYDPGQQYAAHVRDLQLPEQPGAHYSFETYSPTSSSSSHGHRPRNDSFNTDHHTSQTEGPTITVDPTAAESEAQRKRQGHKSWGSTVSNDSMVDTGLDSPTASTSDISKMARTSSTGTMSSDEEADEKDEKDGNVSSFETPNINGMDPDVAVSTRPFRNIGLSKAAQTHKLRKLRTPAKCRECDSYVYFQGAECEECFLSCHKRCLETLAIQCGHKKLQGRLQLFGRDFTHVASCASDGIPFIITKCISEIERRALKMKGIYRVNGVKTRVEKLCQAFENGKELVELSQCSPHDISNVLKLYLRQLPEPIMPFRLYNTLMGLAKESLHSEGDAPEGEEAESSSTNPVVVRGPELVDLGPDSDPEVLVLVDSLKELVKELPKPNSATLRYIVRHLRRIAELEEDNKMSPSNLGIVFGPSLMRPRPTGATISLSSLVDYPHQARIVEALIVFYSSIFQSKTSQTNKNARSTSTQQESVGDKMESTGDGEEDGSKDDQNKPDSDRQEEGCGSSLGSLGSSELLPDSDSDEGSHSSCRLMKQESVVSTEDEQLSYRDSLDLSSHSATHTDPELDTEQDQDNPEGDGEGEPPAVPESGPPEEDAAAAEQEVVTSQAELNESQSNNNNNNQLRSPIASLSGVPLACLCRKNIPLTKRRDTEPEFV
ncbi:rho GTPase-activating protein 45 isoform X1 [Poeciliopsis prolifica]|uniref:rho GTPase-activating protein 45 isoform X1 n=1 Tax=Poeciliopsis prolifica TaxID=188132 RepID=UPI002413A9E5|nr:rho GTPase-activating protein 45 isoform X1 [Poeciliopsis prolifica]